MANTMTLIEAKTLGSTTASVTFSSIPSTYTDLCLKISARNSQTGGSYNNIILSINGSPSGTSHNTKALYTIGTTVGSNGGTSAASAVIGAMPLSDSTANTFSNVELYFPNYANTSTNKSFSSDAVTENNTASNGTIFNALIAGLWASTSAISSLYVGNESGSFLTNSTFYLYGIKNS